MTKKRTVMPKPTRQLRPRAEPITISPGKESKQPRLKRSAVAALFERGLLGQEEMRAALEIERIYVGLAGALFARAGRYEGGGGPHVDLAEALAIAHRDRYKPWADDLSQRRKLGGPPLFEITIDCLVQGQSLHELDRSWRWRHGKAADYLCEALTLYARRAGWRAEPGQRRPLADIAAESSSPDASGPEGCH